MLIFLKYIVKFISFFFFCYAVYFTFELNFYYIEHN